MARPLRLTELRSRGAVEDRARRSLGRAGQAAGRLVRRLAGEGACDRVRLVLAGHEEEELARVAEPRQRQRDPVDERLVPAPRRRRRRGSVTSSVGKFGKSEAMCPSGPSPSRTRSNVPAPVELEPVLRRHPRRGRARPPSGGRLRLALERGRAAPPSPCRSSSARRREGRSARLPTRARRGSSRARARRRARRRGAASSRR